MKSGTLYIVATPIGNLEDISYRAVRVLREVGLIAAEDTRHTRKLLTHYGISAHLTSYFEHNEILKSGYILEKLRSGISVALVTDAGTPCISDPGFRLVKAAVEEEITVVPIPGASAAITALSASGLATDSFAFEGFLPARRKQRRDKLDILAREKRVLVFYESPRRLKEVLADMADIFGAREAVVARELTKVHEEFVRGCLPDLPAAFEGREVKGEVVILVDSAPEGALLQQDPAVLLLDYLSRGMKTKDAAAQAAAVAGIPKRDAYRLALSLGRREPMK